RSDWPQWRGPNRDAICTETGLLKEWPKDGPKLLWDSRKANEQPSVGAGFASMAVAQGKVFATGDIVLEETIPAKKDKDKKTVRKANAAAAFCLDAQTGKELWRTKIGPRRHDGQCCT